MGYCVMGMIGINVDSDSCSLAKRSGHVIRQFFFCIRVKLLPVLIFIDLESGNVSVTGVNHDLALWELFEISEDLFYCI